MLICRNSTAGMTRRRARAATLSTATATAASAKQHAVTATAVVVVTLSLLASAAGQSCTSGYLPHICSVNKVAGSVHAAGAAVFASGGNTSVVAAAVFQRPDSAAVSLRRGVAFLSDTAAAAVLSVSLTQGVLLGRGICVLRMPPSMRTGRGNDGQSKRSHETVFECRVSLRGGTAIASAAPAALLQAS